MDNHILRPALGHIASIGTLYDGKNDCFLTQSLLTEIPPGAVVLLEKKDVDVRVNYHDSYAEKLKELKIGPDLAASLLSGLVQPTGIGHYLTQKPQSARTLQACAFHTITTAEEKLELNNPEVKRCISPSPLRTSAVTHVVVGIEYGAQSLLTITRWLSQGTTNARESSQFQQQIKSFVGGIQNRQYRDQSVIGRPFDRITTLSSTLGTEPIVLNDLEEAYGFLDLVPMQIRSENGGRGNPVLYKLLPIQILSLFNLAHIQEDIRPEMPSHECMKRFIELCDEYRSVKQPLLEHQVFASKYKFCLPQGHIEETAARVRNLAATQQDLRNRFAGVLREVRGGMSNPETLWQLLNDFSKGPRSPKAISTVKEEYQVKVAFIDSMVTQGATYVGHNTPNLITELAHRGKGDAYVFFFSEAAMQNEDSWKANQNLMNSLLSNHKQGTFFAIVDCDATRQPLDRARISQYENGVEEVEDLYDEQEYLADHCFARSPQQALETGVQKPTKRRFVKIPCPGTSCGAGNICEWRCLECRAPLEYGYSDQYIYCDCGRSLYSNFDFKCNTVNHGPGYDRHQDAHLLTLLQGLDQSNYLNILILGETGVGKSTFINAFINYLHFSTLDEALNADGLHWVIPCSFSMVSMDRSNSNSELQEKVIKIGDRADEHDGSTGVSATQETKVYTIGIGGNTYRLIDTPGIGDTRGLQYDKKNMVDILKTISGYDQLHGILILLKSNNSRFTPFFSFCVKELLTHLHRDATHNVVFGFTNTRISNYTPGDTFGTLKKLLSDDKDIGLTLSSDVTYCFDSESFRYLAAYKSGTVMENKPDFESSWMRSSSEAERLLNYFRTKKPHPIKSTISLNGTRNLIIELTKPMAEISQSIKSNIALLEDDVRLLGDARLTGDKLKQKLMPEIQLLRKKVTYKPRTVCKEPGCIEYKDDGTGKTMYADYPKPCHPVCYLENIPQEVQAVPGLLDCAAFLGSDICRQCNHSLITHLHILYELERYKDRVKDMTVESQIKTHASDMKLREAAIQDRRKLMVDWRKEHEQIQEAAAKFGLWMKNNSILPYNDATLAYLDILIKGEQAKVAAGGINNKKALADLEEDKRKHEELVAVLTASMKSAGKSQPIEQDDVERIVQKLYSLKHFGKNLHRLKLDITSAHEQTNREMPHRVKNKHRPRHSTPSNQRPQGIELRHTTSNALVSPNPPPSPSNSYSPSPALSPVQSSHQSLIPLGFSAGAMPTDLDATSSPRSSMPGAFDAAMPSRASSSSMPNRLKKNNSSRFSAFNIFK